MKSLEKLHEVVLTRDIRYYLLLHRGYVYILPLCLRREISPRNEIREIRLRIILNAFQFYWIK